MLDVRELAVAGLVAILIIGDYIEQYWKRRVALEAIKSTLEQGQKVDPEVVNSLLGREHASPPPGPLQLRARGVVAIASGIGLALAAILVAKVWPPILYPALGLAALAVCIGVGLLIASALRGEPFETRA